MPLEREIFLYIIYESQNVQRMNDSAWHVPWDCERHILKTAI